MLIHWNQKFVRIRENLEECFLTKLSAKCVARESFQGRQSTLLGNSDFCSAWFSVRGQSKISLFPKDWQDHQLTGFAGILFGLDIKCRLKWCMLRCMYWIFKCIYLKKLHCWKSEQTQQQFMLLSFCCPNRKQSRSIRKVILIH